MNKLLPSLYLLLISTLFLSCSEEKSPQKEITKTESITPTKTDTLTFISGIRSILHDSKGNYWLGSHSEGVSRFDGKSFEHFTTQQGLPDNQVRTIREDRNGTIWFGTANGVASYDGIKITHHTPAADFYAPVLSEETDQTLWFNAGTKNGIYRYDGQTLKYLAFPVPENGDPNNSYAVTGVSKDQEGTVWIATYSALFHFDGKAIRVFDEINLALKEDELLHIRSVLVDLKGRLWMGNNGIGVLLHQDNSTINFSDKHGLIHANSGKNGSSSPAGTLEHVFAITEDSDGNIWFGDRDTGAWKYDGKSMTNFTVDANLSKQMIWDIYQDANGDLLFAMANGGVYQFNGTSFDKRF